MSNKQDKTEGRCSKQMPKTKNSRERAEDLFRGTLKKYQQVSGVGEEQLSSALGIGKSTLFLRKKIPGDFRLDELRAARKELEIPMDEFLENLKALL